MRSISLVVVTLICLMILASGGSAYAASQEQVLYSFQGETNDGFTPTGGVVFDKAGNLYGATRGGGPESCAPDGYDCGTVYQLAPPIKKGDPWTETILIQFKGKASNDVSVPSGGLIIDNAGNLYGVSGFGGTGNCVILGTSAGCGTVYELSPPKQKGGQWTETILYSFKGGNDGYYPGGNLTFDKTGNLYGATVFGGGKGNTCDQYFGGYCGTVFKLSPPKQKGGNWTEKVLHSFAGGTDGANPNGEFVLDGEGNMYGTTFSGGNSGCKTAGSVGCGTVMTLVSPVSKGSKWSERILHRFVGQDGAEPDAGVILDATGNLFGTASAGGSGIYGVIFEVSKSGGRWSERALYSFTGGSDCATPEGALTLSATGDLYGTTYGGTELCPWGNVFQMKRPKKEDGTWTRVALYSFEGPPDGGDPAAILLLDKNNNLYGTTLLGGTGTTCGRSGCGAVFELRP
jgi:hypothetical protein